MTKTASGTKDRLRAKTLADLNERLANGIRAIPSNTDFLPRPLEATRPTSSFLDPELFAREQARVFRRLPIALALSRMVPEPGSVLSHDGYGIGVLLVRGKDGQVRAFLNTCMHRGAQLVEQCGLSKTGRLTCPYHAWTYSLEGKLIGVPREETFANLDRSERALVQLHCREAGGLIWVILDPEAEPDFSNLEPEVMADISSLGIPEAHVYRQKTFDLKANWKLIMEGFFEPYHIQRLHAQSLQGLYGDVPCVSLETGPHVYQLSGKAGFTPDMLEAADENIHKLVTISIHLFPATIIINSPYYASAVFIIPQAVDRTRVEYVMITPTPADDSPKAADIYQRSFDMITDVFGNEDFRMAESVQKSLGNGALERSVYCGLEADIPDYHRRFAVFMEPAA